MNKLHLIFTIACLLAVWNMLGLSHGHSYVVVSRYPISISPDGQYIATDVYDGTSRRTVIFEPPNSNPVWSKSWGFPCYYSFSSDGKYLAVGTDDADVYVYDWANDTLAWQSLEISSGEMRVSLSANGNYLAVGGSDGVYLFDIADNSLVQSWTITHNSISTPINSVSISPEGDYIAASCEMGENKGAYIYRRGENNPVWYYYGGIGSVSLSENGRYIAVLDYSSYHAHVFTRDDNTPTWSYSVARDVAMSSNGNYIAAVTETGVALFSWEENAPLWSYSLGDRKTWTTDISISADGSYVAAAVSDSGEVADLYLFSRAGGAPIWSHSFRTPWYQNPVIIASLVVVVLIAGTLILVKRRRGLKRTQRRRARSIRVKQLGKS